MKFIRSTILMLFALFSAAPAFATELVMVEEHGCMWCERWNAEIAPIYPKTGAGKFAPLRRVDIHAPMPDDLQELGSMHFTPTFVLVDNGQEIGRIEGYIGEEFFWVILEKMLIDKTEFGEGQS